MDVIAAIKAFDVGIAGVVGCEKEVFLDEILFARKTLGTDIALNLSCSAANSLARGGPVNKVIRSEFFSSRQYCSSVLA